MQSYEQVMFFFILVGVVLLTYIYYTQPDVATTITTTQGSKTKEEFEENVESQYIRPVIDNTSPPPIIERRAAMIMVVMYDMTNNRVMNSTDINVIYNIWYSLMMKRELPTLYATPDLFDKLRDLTISYKLSPETVIDAIKPYYEKEQKKWAAKQQASSTYVGIRHVCSN